MSTPLRDLPVAVIDFETTGPPGPDTHIVSAAVVHHVLGNGEPRLAWNSLVRPPVPIPPAATRIHGIGDADVADTPPFADVVAAMLDAVGDRTIVAFNAPGDYGFARIELDRLGRQPLRWPFIDLLVVRKATKTRGRPGRLHEIAAEYAIALEAHGAVGDALTTALLLRPLFVAAWRAGAFLSPGGADVRHGDAVGGPRGPSTVEDYLAWQRSAALYQERNYADYCRRRGDARAPSSEWHEREGVAPPTWEPRATVAYCERCHAPVKRRIAKDGTLCTVVAVDGEPHVCQRGGAT